MINNIPILQSTESLVTNYPQAVEFANKQLEVFWLPEEIEVSKDIQDILVNMTKAERESVIFNQKLFSLYERKAGADYWSSRFMNTFTRPEFQRMASVFSMFELSVHKPFYNKINELLYLDTDEFYTSYVSDPILSSRMKFIDDIVSNPDHLISLGGFSLVEGGILYSNFGFLKHFQSQGKNKISNLVRGIDFSVRDETIHSIAGAWTYRTLKAEGIQAGVYTPEYIKTVEESINDAARLIYEHEERIIDIRAEFGKIDGITPTQEKNFIKSRINVCLKQLEIPKMFEVDYNPIKEWFYRGTTDYIYNDFFAGIGNQYHRNWDEEKFSWKPRNV